MRCGTDERLRSGVARPRSALIIGSGFGGSIAAKRLADEGVPSVVLERGRRWAVTEDETTFPSLIAPDRRASWLRNDVALPGAPAGTFERYTGLLERFDTKNIAVIRAAGVGGASLVFGGIMLEIPRSLFNTVFPTEITHEEMTTEYYPRVREAMMLRRIPDDILASEHYLSTRVFLDQAEAAGLNAFIVENAIDWDLIRAEIEGSKKPSAILGDYNYGLNSGAKNSLDRTYLARAEATGLVEVRPLHRVVEIASGARGGYRVRCERLTEFGEVDETVVLEADALFLGAGSIGTTELLARAESEGTLPGLPSGVGEGWGNNGQHIFLRRDVGVDTGTFQGGPPTAFIRELDGPMGPVSVENGPGPIPLECQCLLSVGHGLGRADGRLSWNASERRLELEWDSSRNADARAAGLSICEALNAATAGTVEDFAPGQPHTYHPLGGATMGRVCDTFGRVRGHRHLYVVDSALIPGLCPTVNPAFTVAAIAERCLDGILRMDFAGPALVRS